MSESSKSGKISYRFSRRAITTVQAIIIVVIIVVAVVAGGYLYVTSRPSTSAVQGPIQLTWWAYGGIPTEHSYEQQLVNQFNAAQSNIHVTWLEKDWNTKVETLTTSFVSGTAPDVASLDTASRSDLVSIKAYLPLSTTFPSDWQNMSKYYAPEVLPTVEVNGTFYGVPTYFDGAPFLAYNTVMFKNAGIVDSSGNPVPPATWSQVVTDAQKIQQANIAKWGFTFPATSGTNDMEIFTALAYQNGGRWLSADGKTVEMNTPGWVSALQFYSDLVNKYKVSPLPTSCDYFCAFRYFFDNESAMALGFTWVPAIQSSFNITTSFPYRMTRMPLPDTVAGPNPSAAMIMDPTTTFYIMSSTKYQDAAWTFVKFMFNQAVALGGWGPKNGIFGRAPVSTTIFTQPEFQATWPDLVTLYNQGTLFTGAQPMPSFKGLDKMLGQYLPAAVSSVLLGQATAQDALNNAETQSQAYLNSQG
jgi:multiple sugar transport system substrate-binding protein